MRRASSKIFYFDLSRLVISSLTSKRSILLIDIVNGTQSIHVYERIGTKI